MTIQEVCFDISVEYEAVEGTDDSQSLKPETILTILDKRWEFNGAPQLKQRYEELRFAHLEDHELYSEIFKEFHQALFDLIECNQKQILQELFLTKE